MGAGNTLHGALTPKPPHRKSKRPAKKRMLIIDSLALRYVNLP